MNRSSRPKWIDLKSFLESLRSKNVTDIIKVEVSQKYKPEYGLKAATALEEVDQHYPKLISDLRIFDIGESNYWFRSFFGLLLFLVCELGLIILNKVEGQLANLIYTSFGGLVILILSVLIYHSYCYINAKLINKFVLQTLPIFITSTGLIFINYYLVMITGQAESPFLPALIFISVTNISAPRENSIIIFLICLTSMILVIIPFTGWFNYHSSIELNVDVTRIAKWFNLVTFMFSSILIVLQRSHSAKKIN